MTGFGEARRQNDRLALSIEVRALNNRYLKVSLRAPDPYHLLEADFEKVIRRTIKRGTLQIQLRCERQANEVDFRINATALGSYVRQILDTCAGLGLTSSSPVLLGQVLSLPGVVPENASQTQHLEEDWPLIEKTLELALEKLQVMRREEGNAMAQELLGLRHSIVNHLQAIRERVPAIAGLFRDRLLERVRNIIAELDVQIDRNDLIREVSIFAERSDIGEEVVRLAAHLDHFKEMMGDSESPGRKLDFLTQEMFREVNTIGSKASDVEITRQVVAIKGTLEKIRELVQNVE